MSPLLLIQITDVWLILLETPTILHLNVFYQLENEDTFVMKTISIIFHNIIIDIVFKTKVPLQ